MVFRALISQRKYLSLGIYLIFFSSIIALYSQYGSGNLLPSYYRSEQREIRQNQQLLRPMYALLQRELVKSKLNLPFALDNLDLIINFATIHAQLGQGILPAEVKALLQGVLRSVPEQVTALNLLAIDAYKRGELRMAVDYWQKILVLADAGSAESTAVAILRQKVAQTEAKIVEFERIQTKM